jgi:hypothetical protein
MLVDPIMKRLDPSAHTRDLETLSKPCQAFNIQWPGQETSFAEMLNVIAAAGAHPVIAIESCGSETLSGSLCTGREAILDHSPTTQSFPIVG